MAASFSIRSTSFREPSTASTGATGSGSSVKSTSRSLLISTFQPVSFAASLAFCPSLPIARERCLSGTTAVAFSLSLLMITL